MSLCLTCSSSLADDPSTYHTPCCLKPICERCLRRNPRLREYDPCLRCGDLRTSSGVQRVRRGRAAVEENRRREENVFEIGDEDDEDVTRGDDMDSANRGPPPAYDDREGRSGGGEGDADARTHDHDDRHTQRSTSQSGSARGGVRSRSSSRRSAGSVHRDGHESRPDRQDADLAGVEVRDGIDDDPLQVVEVRHPVSRGDTLLAIARKYAADPHDLLTLNDLPPSTLTSQPHLLRTRKTLLISRRSIPRSKLPPSTLFSSTDLPDVPLTDAEREEQAKRERERAIKRFQLLTKSQDPRVGAAYLSLSEYDEGSLDLLSGLEMEVDQDAEQEGGKEGGAGKRGKREWPDKGNREQRALDQYYEDERWEREAGGPRERVEGGWRRVGDGRKMGIKV